MSLSDPIGDMIARIKNAQVRNHKKVALPSSNFKVKIADILKSEGFIKDYKIESENNKPTLSVDLKYYSGNPVISTFERVSKPGRRIFSSADSLPKINGGLGIALLSVLSLNTSISLNQMIALKSVMSSVLTLVSVIFFAISGIIKWPLALSMMVFSMLGGYLGAKLTQKLSKEITRKIIISIGILMTIFMFYTSLAI